MFQEAKPIVWTKHNVFAEMELPSKKSPILNNVESSGVMKVPSESTVTTAIDPDFPVKTNSNGWSVDPETVPQLKCATCGVFGNASQFYGKFCGLDCIAWSISIKSEFNKTEKEEVKDKVTPSPEDEKPVISGIDSEECQSRKNESTESELKFSGKQYAERSCREEEISRFNRRHAVTERRCCLFCDTTERSFGRFCSHSCKVKYGWIGRRQSAKKLPQLKKAPVSRGSNTTRGRRRGGRSRPFSLDQSSVIRASNATRGRRRGGRRRGGFVRPLSVIQSSVTSTSCQDNVVEEEEIGTSHTTRYSRLTPKQQINMSANINKEINEDLNARSNTELCKLRCAAIKSRMAVYEIQKELCSLVFAKEKLEMEHFLRKHTLEAELVETEKHKLIQQTSSTSREQQPYTPQSWS